MTKAEAPAATSAFVLVPAISLAAIADRAPRRLPAIVQQTISTQTFAP